MYEENQNQVGDMNVSSTNNNKNIKFLWAAVAILFALVSVIGYRSYQIDNENKEIKKSIEASVDANQKALATMKEVRDSQKNIERYIEQQQRFAAARQDDINILKTSGYSIYTDIGNESHLTAADMDKIIDYYSDCISGGSRLKGKGKAFIMASKETGLNPVYLFAHAAVESSYGNSYLARTRNNYFGINAVDSNPDRADVMGDSIDQGIIEGAKWIKSNFYDNGYVTLEQMHNGGYASNPDWANSIVSVANTSIDIL